MAVALLTRIEKAGAQWRPALLETEPAVAEALARTRIADGPVIIADVHDNPGAGADSNTTGLLHALLRQGAGRMFPGKIAIGLLNDPNCASTAVQAGVGASVEFSIGRSVYTWSGKPTEAPVSACGKVLATHDGHVVLKGPMMTGASIDAGPSACIEIDGILVAVSRAKTQMLDRALYRMIGIVSEEMKLLVNKSAVHFHPDFDPISSSVIYAKAPGPMAADPSDLPWRHLDPDTALRPPRQRSC